MSAKKKAANKKPAADKPKVVAEYSRRQAILKLELLSPAAWNPRREITKESVADLTESIRTLGLIQPLVVMSDIDSKCRATGKYIIISGHRRAVACKYAGMTEVPCDVLIGVSEQVARRMTFIENLQRADADPLLESGLVERLVADGMSLAEIASETGRGERWVARRRNLAKLSPSWRKRAESGEQITTDCLEHIAAYPKDVQEKLGKRCKGRGVVRWTDVRWEFQRETQDLADVEFDTVECLKCSCNTGVSPELFDWQGREKKLGRCLNPKCYRKKLKEYVACWIRNAKEQGRKIYHDRPPYGAARSGTPTAKCSALYVHKDYEDVEHAVWSEPPKKNMELTAKVNEEEYAKAEEEKRLRKQKTAVYKRLADWVQSEDGGLAWLRRECISGDGSRVRLYTMLEIQIVFDVALWTFVGTRETCARVALYDLAFRGSMLPEITRERFDCWASDMAETIGKLLTSGEYRTRYAERLIAVSYSVRKFLSPAELELVWPEKVAAAYEVPNGSAVRISWKCEPVPVGDDDDWDKEADDGE